MTGLLDRPSPAFPLPDEVQNYRYLTDCRANATAIIVMQFRHTGHRPRGCEERPAEARKR
jgi:hypothetical protein